MFLIKLSDAYFWTPVHLDDWLIIAELVPHLLEHRELLFTSAKTFFFMNGNTERAQCALSRVCILIEKEKKGNEKNKTNL